MTANERKQLLDDLAGTDFDRQREAASRLASSSDPDDVDAAIRLMGTTSDETVRVMLLDWLVNNPSKAMDRALRCIIDAPGSPAARTCLELVGEIVYRQGGKVDPRIVSAVVEALRVTLPKGTLAANSAIATLREIARTGPVPQANDLLLEFMSAAAREPEPYLPALKNAAEILLINDPEGMRDKLEDRLEYMNPETMAAQMLGQVLIAQQAGPGQTL